MCPVPTATVRTRSTKYTCGRGRATTTARLRIGTPRCRARAGEDRTSRPTKKGKDVLDGALHCVYEAEARTPGRLRWQRAEQSAREAHGRPCEVQAWRQVRIQRGARSHQDPRLLRTDRLSFLLDHQSPFRL